MKSIKRNSKSKQAKSRYEKYLFSIFGKKILSVHLEMRRIIKWELFHISFKCFVTDKRALCLKQIFY